jgi:hypothetical protein
MEIVVAIPRVAQADSRIRRRRNRVAGERRPSG